MGIFWFCIDFCVKFSRSTHLLAKANTERNEHTWIAATHVEITVWSGSFYVRATFTTWVQKEKHAESKSRVCMNKIIATIQYAVSW